MNNQAVIPLYINKIITKNLFTIVINEFADIRTVNNKNQVSVNIDTPLSELTFDACKKYTQGDVKIQLMNEFTRQRTEKDVSIEIEVMGKTKKILKDNSLLKIINDSNDVMNIQEKDFIEFSCIFKKNPLIEYIENMVNAMEMELAFSPLEKNETGDYVEQSRKKEVLEVLKTDMNEWKNKKCLRYLSNEIYGTKTRAVIPLQIKYLTDNLDYLEGANITVMGKVVKVTKDNSNNEIDLLSGTCFDYLTQEHFQRFSNKIFRTSNSLKSFDHGILNLNSPLIEVVPIAMYI